MMDARTGRGAPEVLRSGSISASAWLAGAVLLAAALRLHQFSTLVLIDDEWHAIHRVLYWTPARMFVDFNIADYSIPLGLAYWALAHTVGLSEDLMRLPMLVCGVALVALLPWVVYRRLGIAVALSFALLLATSPMLIVFSQTARPYGITLLLAWVAHGAFQRYWQGGTLAGVLYAVCAALAVWLHPVAGPFVVAPFVWGLWQLRGLAVDAQRRAVARLGLLALPSAVLMLALVLPPLLARPAALGEKSGFSLPAADTLASVVHWWLGTSSVLVVVVMLALAAVGARSVLRAFPEARTGLVGLAMTMLAAVAIRPQFIEHGATLGRYLLPAIPLLLLLVAAGAGVLARRWTARPGIVGVAATAASILAPALALAATSPLPMWLQAPNSHRLALHFHFDFRARSDAKPTYHEGIPFSAFWRQLAKAPRDTLTIAAAPFHFESYDWDAHRWELASGQRVIPGFLSGLCVDLRFGEVPRGPEFRLANAVHLADRPALARAGIDYVVWQKPHRHPSHPDRAATGADTAHCEPVLRAAFASVYEDDALIAFRVAPPARAER